MCTRITLLGFLVLAATAATAGASPWQGDLATTPQPAGACADEVRRLLMEGRPALAESAARELVSPAMLAGEDISLEASELVRLLARAMRSNGKQGDPETRRLSELAVEIAVAAAGEPSLDVAENRADLGFLCLVLDDYPAARKELERALEQREAILGPADPRVAQVLTYLGCLACGEDGDVEEAEVLFGRARAIQEATLPADHLEVAYRLSREAKMRGESGDWNASRIGHEQALAIYERLLRLNHPWIAMQHHNLGTVFMEVRDWPAASRHLEMALEMRRSELGDSHLNLAWTMVPLAKVRDLLGEREEARELWQSSLQVFERAVGSQSPLLLLPLESLARDRIASGDSTAAEAAIERARGIVDHSPSARPTDLAWIEGLSAEVAKERGDRIAAIEHLRRGLAAVEGLQHLDGFRSELLGEEGRLVAFGESGIEVGQGVALLEQALDLARREYGGDNPRPLAIQDQLAQALLRADRSDDAFTQAFEAQAAFHEHLRATAARLEECSALSYAARGIPGLASCLRIAAVEPDPDRVTRAWDALVRSRSIVFGEMIERRRLAALSRVPKVGELAQALRKARNRYADLAVSVGADSSSPAWRDRLAAAREDRERAERDLLDASATERISHTHGEVGITEVVHVLPTEAALVSFARIDRQNFGGPEYVALVSPAKGSGPVVRPLGDADAIDGLVTRVLKLCRSETNGAEYRRVAAELRKLVWDPIEASLAGAREICVVPDGALVLLDFAALPIGAEEYLIERTPPIHYLSTERDLLPDRDVSVGRGLLVCGGPRFDRSDEAVLVASAGLGGSPPAWVARGAEGLLAEPLAGLRFTALPSAARESVEVADLWNGRKDAPEAVVLTGAAATEEAFERLARGREVIHLATHGFFLPSSKVAIDPGLRGVGVGAGAPTTPAFALDLAREHSLLSGLAFAGANDRTGVGSDGILLAEEIAGLDLSGVRLAVLSACDTGLGQVQNGEGVFGLRRAFQIAGVRTLVTSLWPVVDETAEARMIDFYRRWLDGGESAAQALRSAALRLLQDRRARGKSTHPFHWAGILAVGARN